MDNADSAISIVDHSGDSFFRVAVGIFFFVLSTEAAQLAMSSRGCDELFCIELCLSSGWHRAFAFMPGSIGISSSIV